MERQEIQNLIQEEVQKQVEQEMSAFREFVKSDKYIVSKLMVFTDGRNVQAGRTTGSRFGTATDQKFAFWKAPVVQAGAISAPSGGATQDAEARTAIGSLITAIKNFGITA